MSGQYPRGIKARTTSTTTVAITEVKLLGGKLYSTDANGNTKLIGTITPTQTSTTSSSTVDNSIAYAVALGDL